MKTLLILLYYFERYCKTHNVRVCLYIAYIACGSALLCIKTLYFFLTVLALSVAATVANIKIHYDAKTPQFPIFGTLVMCVFYSIDKTIKDSFVCEISQLMLFLKMTQCLRMYSTVYCISATKTLYFSTSPYTCYSPTCNWLSKSDTPNSINILRLSCVTTNYAMAER